jgi:hypothetical protein
MVNFLNKVIAYNSSVLSIGMQRSTYFFQHIILSEVPIRQSW